MAGEFHLPETAEASVVGCILLCPDTKKEAASLISSADFSSGFYGALFDAALELKEPDSVVLCELVKSRGYTLPDGFFRELGDVAISRANLELYCQLLREASQRRRLSALASDIMRGVEEERDPAEIATAAVSQINEISRDTVKSEIASPSDASNAFLDHRERVEAGDGAVPTGFKTLDGILGGGMLRSGLYILAARPGMGKTTLLGPAESLDYDRVVNAISALERVPLYISRRSTATVAQIRRMAKQTPDLQCVVIDYLGKIAASNPRVSRYEAITGISGDLKTLAVELGVPVLCLSQLNRENTARQDKRPQLSDLRDSGAVEQDADAVIMLHREDYYTMSEEPLKPLEGVPLEIIVRKNRHGGIGSFEAGFFPATGRIVERR